MHAFLALIFMTSVFVPPAQEVKVTTGPELPYTDLKNSTQVIYDVRDLIDRTSPLWDTSIQTAGMGEAVTDDRDAQPGLELGSSIDFEQRKQRRANLRELARILMAFEPTGFLTHFPPGYKGFAPLGQRIDCLGDGELDITAGPEQHAFVRDFLALQRTSTTATRISFRMVTGPKDSFAKLGLPVSGVLADAEKSRILEQVAGGGFDLLTSPTLSVRPLQRGDLSAVSQFSYVKEYHTQILQPTGGMIADPVIDVINEGVLCRVRSVALPGGAFGLSIDVQNVEVLRPVRTKIVRIVAGSELEGEIMLPEVMRARLSGDMRLAEGATAVFVSPLTEEKDMALFVTLECEPTTSGR